MALHNPYAATGLSDPSPVGQLFKIPGADVPGAAGAGTKYTLNLGGFPVDSTLHSVKVWATCTTANAGVPGVVSVAVDENTMAKDALDPTHVDVDLYVSLSAAGVTVGTVYIWVF